MALSINEQLADRASEHAIDLLRFEATARAEILGFLRRLEVKLDERIRALRLDKGSSSEKRLRLETLLRQVRETLATEYGEMAEAAEQVLRGLARVESAFSASGFRAIAVAADLTLNVLTAQQLRSIASNVLIEGAPSASWWAGQAGDLLQRFSDELREGIASGETTDELVRRIRGRATGRRHRYELDGEEHTFVEFRDGIMDISTRHAEALVRTSVQAVASDARRSTFEENQDVVSGLIQLSTFDTRTTQICLAYGGKAWRLPNYEPIGHDLPFLSGTPRHWGCRSTEAPVLRSWQELGIDLQDAPAGVRWSRLDGKVPGDWTMEDFVEARSDEEVDEQLGPGVAELWREGRISLEDLVDRQSGRPRTLAELELIAGMAA